MSTPRFSLEFFPPKTEDGLPGFFEAVRSLADLRPAFMTVTFGAGGAGRRNTADLAARVQNETGVPTAAHLTWLSFARDALRDYIGGLWQSGIRHIVALRGDAPPGETGKKESGCFRHTDEFVSFLRDGRGFEVSVAAYPEKHPEAPSLAADIAALRAKCEAGAARAITQFFFDMDAYDRFLEEVARAGLATPIVPGLLPIVNFSHATQFAAKCGAHVPQAVAARFEKAGDDIMPAALDLLCEQIEALKRRGVGHIHFYTLNRAGLCTAACRNTGLSRG